VEQNSTRQAIVGAADRLFYQRGFEHTSFADIAAAVEISRGNFYHHFKSKDEILAEVIEHRRGKTRDLLACWESASVSPLERLRSFTDILIANSSKIKMHGCPVGTLCTELAKLRHPARDDANALFVQFRVWLKAQFIALGHGREADALALHLLARSQGIAVLANTFVDDAFLVREVRELHAWLDSCARRGTSVPIKSAPSRARRG